MGYDILFLLVLPLCELSMLSIGLLVNYDVVFTGKYKADYFVTYFLYYKGFSFLQGLGDFEWVPFYNVTFILLLTTAVDVEDEDGCLLRLCEFFDVLLQTSLAF